MVGDHDHGGTVRTGMAHKRLHQVVRSDRVQVLGRLVDQEHPAAHQQRPSKHQAAAFATGDDARLDRGCSVVRVTVRRRRCGSTSVSR